MTPYDLSSVDLNLLIAFDALMEERHVSRAADRLGLTQPALSHALRRLRVLFNDELLTRAGGMMQPTERAIELHTHISAILATVREAISGPTTFDPMHTTRTFVLSMSDALAKALLPRLIARIRTEAPDIAIVVVGGSLQEGWEGVLHGDVEFGVGVFFDPPPELDTQELSPTPKIMVVADRVNPRLQESALDLEAYLELPHVGLSSDAGLEHDIEQALASIGRRRRVSFTVPNLALVPFVVRGTDLLGHCYAKSIEQVSFRGELMLLEPPLKLPRETYRAIWRKAGAADPGRAWLIRLIADTLATEKDDAHAWR